uniref:Uncharacterized protein n=1 Tax=Parastrongyloides trichosuri TaxID=131310 RepID=A0A0N4ZM30_PARTI
MLLINLIIFLLLSQNTLECPTTTGGGVTYNNPTITMRFNTPLSWTYPPTDSTTYITYFLGQAITQTQANLNAMNDITFAVNQAFQTNGYNPALYTITPTYTAPMINDCPKGGTAPTTPVLEWYETQGEIVTTHVTGATNQVTGTACINRQYNQVVQRTDYIVEATISIQGLTIGSTQMTQIINALIAQLSFAKGVRFTENPTVNG